MFTLQREKKKKKEGEAEMQIGQGRESSIIYKPLSNVLFCMLPETARLYSL